MFSNQIIILCSFFGDYGDIPIIIDVDTFPFTSNNHNGRFLTISRGSPLFVISPVTLDIAIRDDAESVHDTGDPTEEGQTDVDEDGTGAAAAMQANGDRGEEDGPEDLATIHKSNSHFRKCFESERVSVIYLEVL